VVIADGQSDFGLWEQVFCGEFGGLRRKRGTEAYRHPVLFPLAIADENLTLGKVQVFDARA
jgi:hypothetical protein